MHSGNQVSQRNQVTQVIENASKPCYRPMWWSQAQIPTGTCMGWSSREQKHAPQKFSHYEAYFFFYSRLTSTYLQADLIGLTGVEKDALWYLVFVERDQQARTGSRRSQSWQTGIEMSCHSTNSCDTHPSAEPTFTTTASTSTIPRPSVSSDSLTWQGSKQVHERTHPYCTCSHTPAHMHAFKHSHTWIYGCNSCRQAV